MQAWHEHHAEVVCADWSNIEKRMFATASWDGVAKVVSRPASHLGLPGKAQLDGE